jgi:hypothetical protein
MGLPGWIASGAALCVLVAWFLAIVVGSLPLGQRSRLLNHPVIMRFVPRWTFFAPIPGVNDFHLAWREATDHGVGPWLEVSDMVPDRSLVNAIWNPDKRSRKAMIDLSIQLLLEAELHRTTSAGLTLSLPYLLLAARAGQDASRFPLVDSFQFAIAADSLSAPEVRPVFVSRVHAV